MQILDLDNKEREVEYVKKIIHETKDMNDEIIERELVEVLIIGNRHDWTTWYKYDEFIELNPDIKIEDNHLMMKPIKVEEIYEITGSIE